MTFTRQFLAFFLVLAIGMNASLVYSFNPNDLSTLESNLQTKSATNTTTSKSTTTSASNYSSTYYANSGYGVGPISPATNSLYATGRTPTYPSYGSDYGAGPFTIAPVILLEHQEYKGQVNAGNRARHDANNNGVNIWVPDLQSFIPSNPSNTKLNVTMIIDGVETTIVGGNNSFRVSGNSATFDISDSTYRITGLATRIGGTFYFTSTLIENKLTGFKHLSVPQFDGSGNRIGQMEVHALPVNGGHFIEAYNFNYAATERNYTNYYFSSAASSETYTALRNDSYTNALALINSKAFMLQRYALNANGDPLVQGYEARYLTKNAAGQFVLRATQDPTFTFLTVVNPAGGTYRLNMDQNFSVPLPGGSSKTYKLLAVNPQVWANYVDTHFQFGLFFYDASKPLTTQTPTFSSAFPSPGNPITVVIDGVTFSVSVNAAGVITAQLISYFINKAEFLTIVESAGGISQIPLLGTIPNSIKVTPNVQDDRGSIIYSWPEANGFTRNVFVRMPTQPGFGEVRTYLTKTLSIQEASALFDEVLAKLPTPHPTRTLFAQYYQKNATTGLYNIPASLSLVLYQHEDWNYQELTWRIPNPAYNPTTDPRTHICFSILKGLGPNENTEALAPGWLNDHAFMMIQ